MVLYSSKKFLWNQDLLLPDNAARLNYTLYVFPNDMIFQVGQNLCLGNDREGPARGKYQDLFSSLCYFIIFEQLPGFSLSWGPKM